MEELNELSNLGKRPMASSSFDMPPPGKRPRAAQDASQQAAALLAAAEAEAEGLDVDALDANSLKRLILHVEKQINANMQMRMKYADQPEKFLDSELELYQSLKGLHALAAAPELYPTFVKSKCMGSLLGLLAHENADIANDTLELLQELATAEDASPDDLTCLIDAFLENDGAATLAHNLERLNDAEEDEAQAVHSTLAVFEAVLEARPDASEALAQKTPLLPWLLNRVKTRGFHANKLFASELLALLLQQQPSNQQHLGKTDGVLSLLTAAAQYKRKEPQDLEESELVENIFNALSAALELPENQTLFNKAEGIELMVMTLKERKYASRCALRVIDAALSSNGANCERFVDIRGFKTLFPLVGGSPPPPPSFAKSKAEKESAQRQHDDGLLSILCTLFHQLEGERRQRLLGKFAEEELVKLVRLLSLRKKYDERVLQAEAAAEAAIAAGGGDDDDEEEDEEEGPTAEERIYLAKVDAGLQSLHKIDVLLGYITTAKAKPLKSLVLNTLYEHGRSMLDVAAHIDEELKMVAAEEVANEKKKDPAREGRLATMHAAVQAIVSKYAVASEGGASAEAGPSGSAD